MPPEPRSVRVDLGGRGYDILIGSGLIGRPESYAGLLRAACGVVVSNTTVAPLHAAALIAALRPHHARIELVVLPDGEAHKQWRTLDRIFDALIGAACDRRTVLYALGGGVVGDMTGFAAACYMRGVAYVQVPTTLLAQVDSSVGGKTAINHAAAKNMIGAFHQPLRVVADLDTLATLPDRELRAGLAEVIKYGPIADAAFIDWTEDRLDALLAREPAALAEAVQRACSIKAEVVAADERESGRRAHLNFGHTFGHAIEAGLGFGTWLHGEAVGCGMVMASALSRRLGLIDAALEARVRRLVARAGLPVAGPPLAAARYLELMRVDKKAEAGAIRFVLLEGAGRATLRPAPDDVVADVIEAHTA